ncbi:MAG: glycosyltransferase family 2 protein [Chloroflexi bacterium]|nr:glycosyltransferase family 2 protein [Chloroflexota bacterium]
MSTRVSVLVPTLDEELNLPECLDSLTWADEVFVLDSYSHDTTVEVARARGATVVQHGWEGYSRQKNWALSTLPFRNDWVLIVDADERVTPELRCELQQVLANPTCDGYYLNRKFIFLGTWIRHAGWYPSWNLRLFRHRLGRYDDREVHEHVVLNGRAGYLRSDLLHRDRRGLEAYISRHNRYSTLEATARLKAERDAPDRAKLPVSVLASPVQRKRFLRERVWPHVPGKPLVLFVYMYFLRRGFLDGRAGLALCVFHAFQEFIVGLKLAELRRLSSMEPSR